jgi:hypothetical protein
MYWCSQAELALSRQNYRIIKTIRIPLAPRGDLAPGSAQARPSAWPLIDTSGNFPVHVSAETPSKISPWTTFEIFKKTFKKTKKRLPGEPLEDSDFLGG